MFCHKFRVALHKDQTAEVFSKKKNGNTIRRCCLRLALFLFVIFAAQVAAVPVTVQYTARVIDPRGSNLAFDDFLARFSLSAVAGPTGTEIPFSGSFTFESEAEDQADDGGETRVGRYDLSDFQINDIPLATDPNITLSGKRIEILLFPTSGTSFERDSYTVQITDVFPPPSDGQDRGLRLELQVDVPAGTLPDDDLPPNVDFFAQGVNFTGIPDFRYSVALPSGSFAAMRGDTVWDSASLEPPPMPDVTIGNVEITQAVFDSDIEGDGRIDLVKDRSTAILVDIEYTDLDSQPVDVEARLADGTLLAFETLILSGTGTDTEFPLIFTPTKDGEDEIIVRVDPNNTIAESVENNNETDPVAIQVHETKKLEIAYGLIIPPKQNCSPPDTCLGTPQDYLVTLQDYDNHILQANEFIWDTYPLAIDGLPRIQAPFDQYEDGQDNTDTIEKDTPCGTIQLSLGFLKDIDAIGSNLDSSYNNPKRSVGIVPLGYFDFHGFPANVNGVQAGSDTVLIEIGAPITTAHEIGHTFDLPVDSLVKSVSGFPREGYQANVNPDGTCTVTDRGTIVDGFQVSTRTRIEKSDGMLDFMGSVTADLNYWVATAHWEELLLFLSSSSEDPELIRISALIQKDGGIELLPWTTFDGVPDVVKKGDYSIQLYDGSEALIANIPFEPSFTIHAEPIGGFEIDTSHIAYSIPYPLATASVAIITPDGSVIAEVDPIIKVLNDTISAIPESCFVSDSLQQRQELRSKVNDVEEFIENRDKSGAMSVIENNILFTISNSLLEECGQIISTKTTKQQLFELLDSTLLHIDGRFVEDPPVPGDLDNDGDVDRDDLNIILAARNTPASGPDDPRDLDGDGTITALDARKLTLLCTRPRCATQ